MVTPLRRNMPMSDEQAITLAALTGTPGKVADLSVAIGRPYPSTLTSLRSLQRRGLAAKVDGGWVQKP